MTPRAPRRRTTGFTLIEVLLATALLAAGLALAFATVFAATRTTERGEALAQRAERMRAVEGFLRRRIGAARPVPFAFDPSTSLPMRFAGESDRLRFVADLPDYLGQGGPHLHELTIVRDGDAAAIELSLAVVLAGETVAERPPRVPERLVDGLRSARFRYRALGEDGRLGEWRDAWPQPDQLPLLVEVILVDADGRPWPPLVVALPLAAGVAAAGVPVTR